MNHRVGSAAARFCREERQKEEMSIACKTLALVDEPELMRIVAKAFPRPTYELEFIEKIDESDQGAGRIELFVVDSKFLDDKDVIALRQHLPTVVIDSKSIRVPTKESSACGDESVIDEESTKIRYGAERLIRKNYFNWIINALEHSS